MPESDVDLPIEADAAADVGVLDLFDLREELGRGTGRPFGFAFRSGVRPRLPEWIEKDRIEIQR